jgi:hypothetical protein
MMTVIIIWWWWWLFYLNTCWTAVLCNLKTYRTPGAYSVAMHFIARLYTVANNI